MAENSQKNLYNLCKKGYNSQHVEQSKREDPF